MSTAALAAPSIIDINMLPAVHRPPQVSWQQIAVAVALGIALIAIVPLAFRLEGARAEASEAQQLAAQAEVELSGLEAELSQQRALRVETDTTAAEVELLVAKRELFQGGRRALGDDLFWLNGFGFLPQGARITSVATTETGFTVDAIASGALDGVAYAANLVETGGFSSARMTSFTPGDGSGGHFSVEVTR